MGSGVDKYKVEYTVYDLLIDEIPLVFFQHHLFDLLLQLF
jgi:hypothetical protein